MTSSERNARPWWHLGQRCRAMERRCVRNGSAMVRPNRGAAGWWSPVYRTLLQAFNRPSEHFPRSRGDEAAFQQYGHASMMHAPVL